jgi:protein-disulfide isomerase
MPLRSPLVLVAGAFLLAACGKQQPPAQTAMLDTTKAARGAAALASDTGLQRADKARIQGSESAKVWFVIASDFQCPYCRAFHDDAYKQILRDYVATGKIRVAYLNHPGSMHAFGVVSAEAAMCAAMQDRFWPMHDGLFTTQDHWAALQDPQPVFDSLATSLQLRMADWRSCMTSHETRSMIASDNAKSIAAGVDGTPNFFIANKLAIKGLKPYATYRAALDSALAQAGPPSGGGQHP